MRLSRDIVDRCLDWKVTEANALRRWYLTGEDRTVEFVLAHVFDGTESLARVLDRHAVIDIFPRHDAFVTNEFIRVRENNGHWRAELCGRPDRHFGEIPPLLQEILIDHDWCAQANVAHSFTHLENGRCTDVHAWDWAYVQPPNSCSYDMVAHVVHAARLVHDAPTSGWYVQASLYAPNENACVYEGRLDQHDDGSEVALDCLVDLVELVPLDLRSPLVRRAHWPEGSYWAEWACFLESHDVHDGPCPLEYNEDDDDSDDDLDDPDEQSGDRGH